MAFTEFIQTAEGLISLITALGGLVGTFLGVFFAIKNWFKALKEKNAKQIWELICQIADAAMKDVEKSTLKGAAKKEAVVSAVKEGCKAAGIDVGPFIDQLGDYIDSCIDWYNGMTKKVSKK